MVGPQSIGDGPAYSGKVAVGNVIQNVCTLFVKVDLGGPLRTGAIQALVRPALELRHADGSNGIRRRPDADVLVGIVLPGDVLRVQQSGHVWFGVAEAAHGFIGEVQGSIGDEAFLNGM